MMTGFRHYTLKIDGNDVAERLYQAFYVTEAIAMLPYGVQRLLTAETDADYMNGFDIISGFYSPDVWQGITPPRDDTQSVFNSEMVYDYMRRYGDVFNAEGAFLSVECAEEAPFNDAAMGHEVIDTAPGALQAWLTDAVDINFRVCEAWAVAPSPPIENEPVISDIPALLISGGFDPITPPQYAEIALVGLSWGQWVLFPLGGHGMSGVPGCAAELTRAFVDSPLAAVDQACTASQMSINWYVEQNNRE